jgi:prepilin-type N-terminal cleavage/methylation domain-containing protein
MRDSKAFTLIELLVVIAAISILSIVTLFILNPAEQLRKSRDVGRLSDLATLQSAIESYASVQGGSNSFSLGSSSVTYLSIPDLTATTTLGTDCSGLGGNFTGGGSFHCPASSTFRQINGQGWIPINFANTSFGSSLSKLPVDPVNTTSSNEYYAYQTDGTTFKVWTFPESQTYLPQTGANSNLFSLGSNLTLDSGNWVIVPGNTAFGTNNFYVMKYDASCASLSTGQALTTPTDGNGYWDSKSAANNCKPVNGIAPASLPNAIPIVDTSQTSTAAYCASIGAHLITNNEWQTIAWNAEQVANNWTGGSMGNGCLMVGHSNGSPANVLVADANDANGYAGEVSKTWNCTNDQRRTLALSDGSIVWDMGGNLYLWTNDTITGANEPYGSAAGLNWYQYTDAGMTYNSMTQATVGPINSAWDSTQNMGELFSFNGGGGTSYGFLRGGYWSSLSFAGAEGLFLDSVPGSIANDAGVRCAR